MNNKGFTLAELLIVVAIIAVLTGISIPVFTTQLEKSREAKDLANVRSAYAEMMVAAISGDGEAKYNDKAIKVSNNTYAVEVKLSQTKKDWQGFNDLEVGGVKSDDTTHWKGSPRAKGLCKVTYDVDSNSVVFNWDGGNLAQNFALGVSSWNSKGEHDTNHSKNIISTNNTGDSKYAGLFELDKDTTYKVTVTYNPYLNDPDAPTKGIIAKATLLFDSNKKNVLDSGTAPFVMNQDAVNKGVTYHYTTNDDGTVTYTATYKTDTKSDKYYYGMNFGGMTIIDYSTGAVDKNSALNFTDSKGMNMSKQDYENLLKQIQDSFVIEKIS